MKKTAREIIDYHEHLLNARQKEVKRIAECLIITGDIPKEYTDNLKHLTTTIQTFLDTEFEQNELVEDK